MNKKSNRFHTKAASVLFAWGLDTGSNTPPHRTAESISSNIARVSQILNAWVRPHLVDDGLRDGVSSDEQVRINDPEPVVQEQSKANEILELLSGDRPSMAVLKSCVEKHLHTFEVKPLCTRAKHDEALTIFNDLGIKFALKFSYVDIKALAKMFFSRKTVF